jgi:carbamate kinase
VKASYERKKEPNSALITLLSKAREGIEGKTGTKIVL